MKKIAFLFVLAVMFTLNNLYANYYFSYTKNLDSAQEYLIELKLQKAENLIRSEKYKNPENIACDYLLNYVLYYKVLVSQNQDEFTTFKNTCTYTIKQINNLPNNNAYKNYLLSEIAIQLAFTKVLFNEYISSAWQLRNANSLLEQNNKAFPNFYANKKNTGLIKALVGTLPDNYKWIVNVVGLKGTFTEGMDLLLHYCNYGNKFNEPLVETEEAKLLYTLLLAQFADDKNKAYQFCLQNFTNTKKSLSQVFICAFVGIEAKKPAFTVQTIYNFNKTNDYPDFYFIDYLLAKAKFYTKANDADLWFKRYVTFYKGPFLIKDSYRKLSWIYLLNKDTSHYIIYRNLSLKDNKELNEEDLNTQKLIEQNKLPNTNILQARVLFDGGFFEEAKKTILLVEPTELNNKYEETEYYYRLGRIYFELNESTKAIESLKKASKNGQEINSYMAPYAEYYIGKMYAKINNNNLAILYYNKALKHTGYNYESTLKQKVKAALNK